VTIGRLHAGSRGSVVNALLPAPVQLINPLHSSIFRSLFIIISSL